MYQVHPEIQNRKFIDQLIRSSWQPSLTQHYNHEDVIIPESDRELLLLKKGAIANENIENKIENFQPTPLLAKYKQKTRYWEGGDSSTVIIEVGGRLVASDRISEAIKKPTPRTSLTVDEEGNYKYKSTGD